MRKLALSKPPESDRIVGFTIPKAGSFYICAHDEVWCAAIEPNPTVQVTDHQPYEFIESRTDFLGPVFEGLRENSPLLRVGHNEIALDIDPKKGVATVRYSVAGRTGQIKFRTPSGDWFAASFSDDGRYLILEEPYELAVYAVT